jgi:hypothetical protein
MNHSDSVGNLGKALAKAQTQLSGVRTDSTNPHFKSRYASLAAVNDAVLPVLSANGIAVLQGLSSPDIKCVGVSTTFIHGESGEWWTEELFLPPARIDPQGFGSAITYGRRYLLMAMAGVATDDDDGNEASKSHPVRQEERAEPKLVMSAAKNTQSGPMGDERYPADWTTPAIAQEWTIKNKYCMNLFEAKNSFKNSLNEVTGQDRILRPGVLPKVFQNFYVKHTARASEQQLDEAA